MKVFILDDSPVMRERLIALFSDLPEIEIIGEAEDPLKGIHCIRELKPDAVILDVRNQRRSGIDILRNIKKNHPSPVVLMLTNKFYSQEGEKSMDEKVDFLFDKFTEFNKIATVFKKLTRSFHGEQCLCGNQL